MNDLVFFINKGLLSGMIIGSIYAMGAIGVTMIFGILRFAHFAHGDMMTLGAFVTLIIAALLASAGVVLPCPIAFAAIIPAMAVTAVLAIGLDRIFYKPLRNAGARPVVLVMASVGVTLMLQGLIRLFAGVRARDMFIDQPKDIFQIPFPGATRAVILTEPQIVLIGFTVVAVLALHLFLTRSRLGKAMRAVSDNPELARITGINTNHVVWATWIIGGGLACAAGSLLSMDVTLKPDLSFNILLPIFAATIVGGIGQPYGAIAGGFLVGFCETLAVFNWSVLLRPIKDSLWFELPRNMALVPTEYKLMVPFLILIIVLIYRPTGIFRGRVL
ncbi:branched-chain amino acid ABC transporter permease [Hoeflea sp. WL0058]|uniref:Branched-chain amino acid ABC transporter permease n=1 Tax=Flavimaribacter sediminis TaxID=2865987 RepID=A0AAE2ZS91_9HYPH|nr:branched-chain amino acid ABC transporter permease [Flavimaribacter sediminis]